MPYRARYDDAEQYEGALDYDGHDPAACPNCGGPQRVYMGGGMWDDCPCDWGMDGQLLEDRIHQADAPPHDDDPRQ